jgi:hypothetical protein
MCSREKTLLEIEVLYHRKLFAEYVKAEVGNDVVQEVASTYVTVNMEGHLSLDPLPFCQYFISLQLAVPSLELQHFQTGTFNIQKLHLESHYHLKTKRILSL